MRRKAIKNTSTGRTSRPLEKITYTLVLPDFADNKYNNK